MNQPNLKKLIHNLYLLLLFTRKEHSSHYKQTVFGIAWAILNPLFNMLVIGLIFSRFLAIPNYYFFLITGLFLWQFLSQSLTLSVYSFTANRTLLKKTKFFQAALPLSVVLSNLINTLIAYFLLVVYALLFMKSPDFHLIYFFLSLFLMFILTASLSLLISSLYVRYRDFGPLTQSLLFLWFYLSPVLWDISLLPAGLDRLAKFNPAYFPLALMRSAFGISQAQPTITGLLLNLACLTVITSISFYIFQKFKSTFVDYL